MNIKPDLIETRAFTRMGDRTIDWIARLKASHYSPVIGSASVTMEIAAHGATEEEAIAGVQQIFSAMIDQITEKP